MCLFQSICIVIYMSLIYIGHENNVLITTGNSTFESVEHQKESVEKIINDIRKKFANIENNIGDFHTLSAPEVGVTGYFCAPIDGVVSFEKISVLEPWNKTSTDYYIRDGLLFFIFRTTEDTGPTEKIKTIEERYYFHNGKIIRYLTKSAYTDNNYINMSTIANKDMTGKTTNLAEKAAEHIKNVEDIIGNLEFLLDSEEERD